MAKGKKRAVTAPPQADSNKESDVAIFKPRNAAGDNKKVAVKIVGDRGIESLKIIALEKPV